ncbi:MAG: hypothetical protein J6V13_05670 [Paludibacteraceae bacterium]|nr:hypothetical protein [Paludibacteraceae bacterium]MBO7258740.1 hypothetical protein [Paludibacteraceae bacterium]
MNKQTKLLVAAGISIILILLAITIWSLKTNQQTKIEMAEMEEMINFEKEQLEEEFNDLAMQFDGYGADIHNDSLVMLLDQEKQKVAQLLEELKLTKATNARRIAELKKELATVRAVMVQYVHQIDSLDRINKTLVADNIAIKKKYEDVSQQAEILQQEKEVLHQTVIRASMLEINNFTIDFLNKKDRSTKRYTQIAKIKFAYTIAKNITTQPGMKTIYLRILRPDGEVLQKSPEHLFPFENTELIYSLKKDFEYAGEPITDELYWTVEEILPIGEYSADFFIDGRQIARHNFRIEK